MGVYVQILAVYTRGTNFPAALSVCPPFDYLHDCFETPRDKPHCVVMPSSQQRFEWLDCNLKPTHKAYRQRYNLPRKLLRYFLCQLCPRNSRCAVMVSLQSKLFGRIQVTGRRTTTRLGLSPEPVAVRHPSNSRFAVRRAVQERRGKLTWPENAPQDEGVEGCAIDARMQRDGHPKKQRKADSVLRLWVTHRIVRRWSRQFKIFFTRFEVFLSRNLP